MPDRPLAQHDDTERAAGNALINLAAQAVANPQLELVVPDTQALLLQSYRQRSNDLVFVLRCVGNKDVPVLRDQLGIIVVDRGNRLPQLIKGRC